MRPALLPLLCAGTWLGVLAVVSLLGGWYQLSQSYRRPCGRIPATTKHFTSISVSGISYNRCITAGTDADGLYLAVLPPLAFMHPPLYIPFDRMARSGTGRFLWKRFVRYKIDGIDLKLYAPAAYLLDPELEPMNG